MGKSTFMRSDNLSIIEVSKDEEESESRDHTYDNGESNISAYKE